MTSHLNPGGIENQPVGAVQWVARDTLHANSYNSNHVAPTEMELLKRSILEDGWTQPIVAREDGEIVDGFHRWTVAGDPDVAALTGGLVPVVRLRNTVDLGHQMMSTIRHNRARGNHAVVRMADIVATLRDELQLSEQEIMERLGMEWEEVDRLYDRGGMLKRGAAEHFNNGWVPR